MLSATRADAGFTSVPSPGPQYTADDSPFGADFTPRCDVPDLKLETDAGPRGHATVLDLPDAWDFRQNQQHDGEDHLVARLNAEKQSDKPSYSLFWEDHDRGKTDRGGHDLGIDVKSSAPVVVPLPQGVWAGLIGLGCVVWHQIRRHRRQLA